MKRSALHFTALGATLALIVTGFSAPAAVAAEAHTVSGVTLEWGVNGVYQRPAPNGACNYFTAGATDGTASTYATVAGNVSIIKRNAAGAILPVTASNRCDAISGSENGQRAVFAEGSGSIDKAAGTASITWTGTLTLNGYGGLVPWRITNPRLEVSAGQGRVVADLGGYGADMNDLTVKHPLESVHGATILELRDVVINEDGVTGTPIFDNVDYFPLSNPEDAGSTRVSTSAIPAEAKTQRWGAWPRDMVDFQYRTGLRSYWHSSAPGDAAAKAPVAPAVRFSADDQPVEQDEPVSIKSGPKNLQLIPGETATFTVTATGTALRYQWQRAASWRGPWADIAGATASTYVDGDVAESDAGYLRVVVSNPVSTANSFDAELEVKPAAALVQTFKPRNVTVYEGARLWLINTFAGYPDPVYTYQRSVDGGKTWAAIPTDSPGASYYSLAATGSDWNSAQYRVLAQNRLSNPVEGQPGTVTVLPRPAVQGLILDPNEHAATARFNPEAANDIAVLGASFTTGKTVQFGLVETAAWASWTRDSAAIPADAIAWSQTVDSAWGQFPGGYFTRTARPTPGAMHAGTPYVVAVWASDGTHDMDAAVAVPLVGVESPGSGPGTPEPGVSGPGTTGSNPGAAPGAGLAATGGHLDPAFLGLGAVLVAAGAVLALGLRRRRKSGS